MNKKQMKVSNHLYYVEEKLQEPGERKMRDLGAWMVSVLGRRHASKRDVMKCTQMLPRVGRCSYLEGGGSHSGNVYAFMHRKNVISLLHSYFLSTSNSF